MSRKPWFYVKGRRDLTEKRIASRREKEAQQNERWNSAQKYFNRCSFETKLHNQWKCDKSLQRISRSAGTERQKPPFDVDFDLAENKEVLKEIETARNEANSKLKALFQKFAEREKEMEKLREDEQILFSKLIFLFETNENLKCKEDEWKLREKRLKYVRFGCDKLKHKGYLICEKLYYFKILIEIISDKSIFHLLLENEAKELTAIKEDGLKIIEMYIDINHKRTTEFITLFQEEAEIRWLLMQPEWEREQEVWETLVTRVLEVYFSVIKVKLEDNISKQDSEFTLQKEAFKELSDFIDKIKNDPRLVSLLDIDIE